MSARNFELALAASHTCDGWRRLHELTTGMRQSTSTGSLDAVAKQYLTAFCSDSISSFKRRWIGLALCRFIELSTSVAGQLPVARLSGLGQIILEPDGAEENRLVAGLIMRQLLRRGLAYTAMWPSKLVPDTVPDFPISHTREWIRRFEDFLDDLSDMRILKLDKDPVLIFAISAQASNKLYLADPESGALLFLLEGDCVTLLSLSSQQPMAVRFIDIPLQHVQHVDSRRATLHDSQGRQDAAEPWELLMTLDPKHGVYMDNAMETKGEKVTIMFEHANDAKEAERCIGEVRPAVMRMASVQTNLRVSTSCMLDISRSDGTDEQPSDPRIASGGDSTPHHAILVTTSRDRIRRRMNSHLVSPNGSANWPSKGQEVAFSTNLPSQQIGQEDLSQLPLETGVNSNLRTKRTGTGVHSAELVHPEATGSEPPLSQYANNSPRNLESSARRSPYEAPEDKELNCKLGCTDGAAVIRKETVGIHAVERIDLGSSRKLVTPIALPNTATVQCSYLVPKLDNSVTRPHRASPTMDKARGAEPKSHDTRTQPLQGQTEMAQDEVSVPQIPIVDKQAHRPIIDYQFSGCPAATLPGHSASLQQKRRSAARDPPNTPGIKRARIVSADTPCPDIDPPALRGNDYICITPVDPCQITDCSSPCPTRKPTIEGTTFQQPLQDRLEVWGSRGRNILGQPLESGALHAFTMHPLSSKTKPTICDAEDSTAAIQSSNSEVRPASPHIGSQAITGHASSDALKRTLQFANCSSSGANPFHGGCMLARLKPTHFTRRLTGDHQKGEQQKEHDQDPCVQISPLKQWPSTLSKACKPKVQDECSKSVARLDIDPTELKDNATLVDYQEQATPCAPITTKLPQYFSPTGQSSHSSTSAEPSLNSDDREVLLKDNEEMKWKEALQSHQRPIHQALTHVSQRLLRRIVNQEIAAHDIANDYIRESNDIIKSIESTHHHELKSLCTRLGNRKTELRNALGTLQLRLGAEHQNMRKRSVILKD